MIHVLNSSNEQDLAALAVKCTSLHILGEGVSEYWSVQRRLLLHADRYWQLLSEIASAEVSAWILARLGNLYADQGRLMEAEAMYERLQGYEKALGRVSMMTYVPFLNAVTNLGALYAELGQEMRAKELYTVALIGIRKVFGATVLVTAFKKLEHNLPSLSHLKLLCYTVYLI